MLIVNSRFLTQPVTGVQRFAIEISLILKKHYKNEIKFVSPSNIIHFELAKQLDAQVVGKKTGHIWEQIDLPNYLKKEKPLLLNFCNTAPLFYQNKIVTVHDVAFEVYPKTYSKGFVLFYKYLIPKIIKNSHKVITVSEFSKEEIIKYYNVPSDKIEVVYNAVGTEFTKVCFDNLDKEDYFLAVSSLNQRKNLLLVLDAFLIFSKENPNYKLFLIGGIDKKSFSSVNFDEYKKNPNIFFKGRVSDQELVNYYSNAIAFIYPSFYEGFGIPPLEAQKCETPVILSNATCFPEVFDNSVLYCDVHNEYTLVEQMISILNNTKREEIILVGKENQRKYSWENSANCIIKIISNLCS